jgi:hypothetical protein
MYKASTSDMTIGVHLVTFGAGHFYKPWFFDGSAVYWGLWCDTESAAFEQAEILRDSYS